ncbi:hypothetical protein ENUP19_0350G0005 [Entamoeba nuttalli]|uniref:Hydrolase, alpha/beta fold family domain containing protein n=2 Tax=Entamoeba nuttalli TaxID=412467 RepID=K2GTL6_ENTNP|nr:hydrolase, alpha/beta fold family domain containing protein [Entamoeba nuttalli P19]EKE38403.1 hydrolase, alpha/beta fold family domain containing protein [Entamoeba nuttalli P19]|eukprot:XP_008859265.1 hydrolase, alpha/beta fold family domain containing protein [Entamoeba nuttalli P19]
MTFEYKETFHQLNGFNIYSREWRLKEAKATIIILHGYGEYSGRYTKVGEFFVNSGFNVFMLDLPGHGRSSGIPNKPKTFINSMETYINTLNEYIEFVKDDITERGISLPLFFMGHSMGGLLTSILASRRNDITAYVASAPAYVINNNIVYYLYYLFILIIFFFPSLMIPTNPADEIFTNKEVAREYDNDPYTLTAKASGKTGLEMARYGDIEKDRDLTVPFYLMHGSGDTLIKVEGARNKAKHLKNPLSKYVEYPGANHVLLEEDNQQEMLIDINKWLDSVIQSQ